MREVVRDGVRDRAEAVGEKSRREGAAKGLGGIGRKVR